MGNVDMKGRDSKGWLSVIGSVIAIFFSGAMVFGFPGVMATYWTEQFGNGGNYVTTFNLIALGFGMFFAGKLHMKTGTRVSYQRGAVLQIVAIIILYLAQNIQMVWLYSFLTGLSSSFIYSPGLANAQNWFPNKKGLVTGIVNLSFGCAGAIMAPIMNGLLSSMGNGKMLIILLILNGVFMFAGSFMSEMPDRAKMTDAQKAAHEELLASLASKGGSKGPSASLTTTEALKTKRFWALWLTWAFMGAAGISMISLSKSYSVFLGITGVMALTTFNLTNGISRIIAGALSDIIGRRTLGSVSFIIGAVGYIMLPRVSTLVPLCICTACVGYAFGTLFAISGPLTTDLFGLKYFGTIFGLVFTAYGFIGGILGPMVATAVLTSTGSYVPVFTYLAVFCVIAAVCIFFAKDSSAKSK